MGGGETSSVDAELGDGLTKDTFHLGEGRPKRVWHLKLIGKPSVKSRLYTKRFFFLILMVWSTRNSTPAISSRSTSSSRSPATNHERSSWVGTRGWTNARPTNRNSFSWTNKQPTLQFVAHYHVGYVTFRRRRWNSVFHLFDPRMLGSQVKMLSSTSHPSSKSFLALGLHGSSTKSCASAKVIELISRHTRPPRVTRKREEG